MDMDMEVAGHLRSAFRSVIAPRHAHQIPHEILSSGIFATKCIVFPRLAHRPYTKEIEKPRFYRPKARIANPQISRGSGAQRTGYRPTRVLHATAPSSSGPASTHTAKFEPAAWSRAQMTSGSGAPKRVLTEEASSDHIQT